MQHATHEPPPDQVMAGFCPVCHNPIKAVVYERHVIIEKGHSTGANPQPVEREREAQVRTEMFSCGLERSRRYMDGRWGPNTYHQDNKCANAQSVVLSIREKESHDIQERDEHMEARLKQDPKLPFVDKDAGDYLMGRSE